mgnify:CR=1 FL=1
MIQFIQLAAGTIAIICGIILGGSWIVECINMNPDDMFPGDEED